MDINQVIADITTALQDAYAVAGTLSPMDQLTAAAAALSTANAALAALTVSDNALKSKLAKIQGDIAQAAQDAA